MTKCPYCGKEVSETRNPQVKEWKEQFPEVIAVQVFCDEKCHEKYMESKVE